MKNSLRILLAATALLFPAQGGRAYASDDTAAAIPLDEALAQIERKWGYSFVFDSRLAQGRAIAPFDENAPPLTALAARLRPFGLVLRQVGPGSFVIASALETEPVSGAAARPEDAGAPSRIVVTGTRIPHRDALAPSPVYTVDAESFRKSGSVSVEHYLNTLPQFVPEFSSQSNNPGRNGRAFLDLRGFGAARNLVLVDGRRVVGSMPGGLVDVNVIPSAFVQRVEVAMGGAAAAYGADAVSGVVNFILNKSHRGLSLDGQFRITELGDGRESSVSAHYGTDLAGGAGNFTASASYFRRQGFMKSARPFSAQADDLTLALPGGSWFVGANPPSQAAVDAMLGVSGYPVSGGFASWGFNPDGTLFGTGLQNNPAVNAIGYTGPAEHVAMALFPDVLTYEYQPQNKLVLPLERMSFFAAADFEAESWLRPYATLLFTTYAADQELAATPAPLTLNPFASVPAVAFSVPVTNPFIGSELRTLLDSRANPGADFLIRKRFTEVGNRLSQNSFDFWHAVAGANGEMGGGWSYDAYVSYGHVGHREVQPGNVHVGNVQTLLDAPDGGASLCDGGYNPFGLSSLSPQCAALIGYTARNHTSIEQIAAEATASGPLASLPAGEAFAAIGASWRRFDYDSNPDRGLTPGIVAGQSSLSPLAGALTWTDLFAEARIPLVSDQPILGSATAILGWRGTRNSQSGIAQSWTTSALWEPSTFLRFRGGYQRALRSPSVEELYAARLEIFPNIAANDPCNTSLGAPNLLSQYRLGPNGAQIAALCAAQSPVAGAANFNQPIAQARAVSGGNPDLSPERSRSWSVGFVLSDTNGFTNNPRRLSVDYWSIRIEDVIATSPPLSIIRRCFNQDNANPNFDINNEWCRMFGRDPLTGGIIDIEQRFQNLAAMDFSGIDVSLSWTALLDDFGLSDPGVLEFTLVGTWLRRAREQRSSADPVRDRKGTISQVTGTAYPEFGATAAIRYVRDAFDVTATARYIDSMDHFVAGNEGTRAAYYVDLAARHDVGERVSLRAGVNNLFDQGPRLFVPYVQGGTDPSTFDILGRRFFIGANVRL